MRRVRDGETDAMSTLFVRHQRSFHALARRLLGNPAAAEDAVQQSFLHMLHRSHTFRDDSRFLPWAYQVLRNCCADAGVRSSRLSEEPFSTMLEEQSAAAPSEAPQRVASDREQLALLRDALLTLPFDRREVIVLARLEQRSAAEIAELLECTEGAVRVRLHRAVADLRAAFERRLASGGAPRLGAMS